MRLDTRTARAVVVGGSLGGLLAAHVLASYVDDVVVVERDRLPDGPAFRSGVPQSRQHHLLWARGLDMLDGLLPGFRSELLAAGAMPIALPSDMLWLNAAGWGRRFPPTHRLLSASRELLEHLVRARVRRSGRVRFLTGHEVTGLVADASGVRGVRLRARPGEADRQQGLPADLVVDASGRSSRMPRWLADLGRRPPAETRVDAFLGYACRQYRLPHLQTAGWKGLLIQAKAPDDPRGGSIFPVEGDRYMVTLVGAAREHPPTDADGFLDFARALRSPVLYESIRDGDALTPVRGYQRTANLRRHYERLPDLPAGVVVLGDAACALNPLYAHGMSVAALQAAAFDRRLRQGLIGPRRLARQVQRDAARCAEPAWLIATGEDLRYPTTVGGRVTLPVRLTHRYLTRVNRRACSDERVARALLDVLNLVDRPQSLFRPGVVARTLLAGSAAPLPAPPAEPLPAAAGDAAA
jgi:2-polyprenyl-6-methoxyphenol hydroxylase-like FAD-dependent oxidoreductase